MGFFFFAPKYSQKPNTVRAKPYTKIIFFALSLIVDREAKK